MANHFCIANPCWICYPEYAPNKSETFQLSTLFQPIGTEKYIVHFASWDIDPTYEFDPNNPDKLPWPSATEIDKRTIRSLEFSSEDEAEKFAEKYLENHKDDEWLAYVEITKCVSQMIKKLK